ncbi:MAG: hypothetical protein ABGY96_23490 [bacterium]|nr:hypothetical protein [Gammaproteobacteria bacterium]HIL94310.1 hypothetical protein [Pseudomonadales bacterium]
MGLRLTKPFLRFTKAEIDKVGGSLGVFQLGDDDGHIVYIGYAGGRSLFGLKGCLTDLLGKTSATCFRYEINSAYLTRHQELLMVYIADHDELPAENDEKERQNLGRLSPG